MKNGKIKVLNISDIHFGNSRNKTKDIINNINSLIIENNKEISDVDLLLLTGDEFDTLLSFGSEETDLIIEFFLLLCSYCSKHNIIVRCIEGTNSHCYKQMKKIETIIKNSLLKVNFKYIDKLDIEYIPELDINVLYVPDELNDKASITFNEVKSLLLKHKLDKVDIAAMHGAFRYQLPKLLESSHYEEDYLNIVKYFIFIGHIHTHSVYKRIIAPGSVDRLAHSEEEDKGVVLTTIFENRPSFYKFIVNKKSKIFKTFEVNEIDLKDLNKRLGKEFIKLPDDSYVRLKIDENNPIRKNLIELKKLYPNINFTDEKINKLKISNNSENLLESKKLETIIINKDNIIDLIFKEIGEEISGEEINILNIELKQLI